MKLNNSIMILVMSKIIFLSSKYKIEDVLL